MKEAYKSRGTVFIIMPFSLRVSKNVFHTIRSVCKELKLNCERADSVGFSETVVQHIYDRIKSADLIIADITGKNPNVFYEVGYAHGKDKLMLLITQDEDSPFNISSYPHQRYDPDDLPGLGEMLLTRIPELLSLTKLVFTIDDVELRQQQRIMKSVPEDRTLVTKLKVENRGIQEHTGFEIELSPTDQHSYLVDGPILNPGQKKTITVPSLKGGDSYTIPITIRPLSAAPNRDDRETLQFRLEVNAGATKLNSTVEFVLERSSHVYPDPERSAVRGA